MLNDVFRDKCGGDLILAFFKLLAILLPAWIKKKKKRLAKNQWSTVWNIYEDSYLENTSQLYFNVSAPILRLILDNREKGKIATGKKAGKITCTPPLYLMWKPWSHMSLPAPVPITGSLSHWQRSAVDPSNSA